MTNQKTRVLQVLGSLNMGGAECRMMDIYRNIDRNKYQFDFISMLKGVDYYENEVNSLGGTVFHIAPARGKRLIRHFTELYKCIKNGKYDAVHAHTSFHCGLVMFAAWLSGVPVRISHSRNLSTLHGGMVQKLEEIVGKILISLFATHRIAISSDAGKYLFGNHKFRVVPNSIDTGKYQNVSDELITKYKSEFGIAKDEIVIGQIGRFNDVKNHKFTIAFFEQYVKTHPKTKLVFVGGSSIQWELECQNEIKSLIEIKGLSDKVIFTGVRNDIPQFIHVFDVLIFPSFYEGLGGVAIEAQAAGIPVVENETLPNETDMGIDLLEKCSLDAPLEDWKDKIELSLSKNRPSYSEINKAFEEKGFSIEGTTKILCGIYKHEEINSNNYNL